MIESATLPQVIQFGVYELDVRSQELRKQGVRVKLQSQPLQLLQTLLERPGEIVTRNELQKRIWQSDTFVDFDHGIANAIKRLREALCDTPDNPRFVETIPRKGYRFIATIKNSKGFATEDLSGAKGKKQFSSGRRSVLWKLVGAVALAAVPVLLPGKVNHWPSRTIPPENHSLAVLPLRNLSSDQKQEYFADAMNEELITELSHLNKLRVISGASVMRYKNRTLPVRSIAHELGVNAVVDGAIMHAGERVRVTAELIDARSEEILWAQAYECDLRDVLSLQRSLARAISDGIKVKLTSRREGQPEVGAVGQPVDACGAPGKML
jgi:TolB-like protein/DNA-binding winged helix-turn-helix (wHTH) protein